MHLLGISVCLKPGIHGLKPDISLSPSAARDQLKLRLQTMNEGFKYKLMPKQKYITTIVTTIYALY